MQIVSIGDNSHEMSILFSAKNEKKIFPIYRLLKSLPRVKALRRPIFVQYW